MGQVRLHIPDLQGLDLKDYRNIPKISAILCEQWGFTELWWFMLGQLYHESLIWDDSRRDYKAASPYFNGMGMRPAKVRKTYQMEGSIKDAGKYGQYANYADMVADLLQWYKNNNILQGLQIQKARGKDYVNFGQLLKDKNYMTGNVTSYNNGINAGLQKYGNQLNAWLEAPFFGNGVVTTSAGATTPEESFTSSQGETRSFGFNWKNPIYWGLGAVLLMLVMPKKKKGYGTKKF